MNDQWIKTADRKPTREDVVDEDGKLTNDGHVIVQSGAGFVHTDYWNSQNFNDGIYTAWQPLPAPYVEPQPEYRTPTQADCANGPIECEVSATGEEGSWVKRELFHVANGTYRYGCLHQGCYTYSQFCRVLVQPSAGATCKEDLKVQTPADRGKRLHLEIVGKLTVVPMPINVRGSGPETDPSKVVTTIYQLWDETNFTVAECTIEEHANSFALLYNTAIPAQPTVLELAKLKAMVDASKPYTAQVREAVQQAVDKSAQRLKKECQPILAQTIAAYNATTPLVQQETDGVSFNAKETKVLQAFFNAKYHDCSEGGWWIYANKRYHGEPRGFTRQEWEAFIEKLDPEPVANLRALRERDVAPTPAPVDWAKAPEWAKWIATDDNKTVWWYDAEPLEGFDIWVNDGIHYGRIDLPPFPGDWRQSKLRREG